jgi:hypothetical protein
VLHRSVGAFHRARREAEVVAIGGSTVVNGILNGAVTGVKEGGGDYCRLKRGWSY